MNSSYPVCLPVTSPNVAILVVPFPQDFFWGGAPTSSALMSDKSTSSNHISGLGFDIRKLAPYHSLY